MIQIQVCILNHLILIYFFFSFGMFFFIAYGMVLVFGVQQKVITE